MKVMKEDYLWDKTGEDAEIQDLENALKAFRYQETAPPELPAKVFTVEKEKPRRFFQFGFAFASFAAVVVVLSVVWFQTGNNKKSGDDDVAQNSMPKTEDKFDSKTAGNPFDKSPETTAPPEKIESRPRAVKPNIVKARQLNAPVIRPNKAVVRNIKVKEPAETLTAEEKYAYDQLMLALSITGSTLRMVKDKIDGIEEKNAVLEKTK